jgi:hypothetical protein
MDFLSGGKTAGLLLFSYVLLSLFSSVIRSSPDGIIDNSSRPGSGNCTSCHGGTLGSLMTITGANLINAGSFNDYTVTVTGGSGTTGGFNLAVDSGTLVDINPNANADNVRIESGRLTHEGSASKTWLIRWQAPATPGTFKLYVSG